MKISPKQYAEALLETVDGKKAGEVKEAIKRFVEILHNNNDISKFGKIVKKFYQIWNAKKGIVEAEIVSANELDKEILKLLNSYIVKLSGAKEVIINKKVDKNIIGGVVIKYNDMVVDGSLKNKLIELKSKMIK